MDSLIESLAERYMFDKEYRFKENKRWYHTPPVSSGGVDFFYYPEPNSDDDVYNTRTINRYINNAGYEAVGEEKPKLIYKKFDDGYSVHILTDRIRESQKAQRAIRDIFDEQNSPTVELLDNNIFEEDQFRPNVRARSIHRDISSWEDSLESLFPFALHGEQETTDELIDYICEILEQNPSVESFCILGLNIYKNHSTNHTRGRILDHVSHAMRRVQYLQGSIENSREEIATIEDPFEAYKENYDLLKNHLSQCDGFRKIKQTDSLSFKAYSKNVEVSFDGRIYDLGSFACYFNFHYDHIMYKILPNLDNQSPAHPHVYDSGRPCTGSVPMNSLITKGDIMGYLSALNTYLNIYNDGSPVTAICHFRPKD